MHKRTAAIVAVILMLGLAPAGAQDAPRKVKSPPGQVKIMTINARQNAVLGVKRFEDMYELSWAVRRRPEAFDGGFRGGVAAPDVIALQEVRSNYLEIFVRLLRQRFKVKYQSIGPEQAASQLIYNPETLTPVGDVVTWEDVCSDRTPGKRENRFYEFARFTEKRSGAPFTVAAMHIPKNFVNSGQSECYFGNMQAMRDQLAGETSPVFVAGDFNRRAVEQQHECDPNERSAELQWHRMMTQPTDGGLVFVDAARTFHRQRGLSMKQQWTHEQKTRSLTCDGDSHFRRARIDYIFSSGATVAEAFSDSPGWSGGAAGSRHPTNHKYSDHRFVWGRFVLAEIPRVKAPEIVHGRKGAIDVSWPAVEGATGYVVYRALQGRDYDVLARVGAPDTTYRDGATEHGVTYKYSIAAEGVDNAQGLESRHTKMTIDARGPKIVGVSPTPSSTGVDRRAVIRIVFDERVRSDSVTTDRIRLFRGTKRLSGTVRQVAPRVLEFDPTFPLWKGKVHRVVTKPVQDRYRNVGSAMRYSFTTERGRKRR